MNAAPDVDCPICAPDAHDGGCITPRHWYRSAHFDRRGKAASA